MLVVSWNLGPTNKKGRRGLLAIPEFSCRKAQAMLAGIIGSRAIAAGTCRSFKPYTPELNLPKLATLAAGEGLGFRV